MLDQVEDGAAYSGSHRWLIAPCRRRPFALLNIYEATVARDRAGKAVRTAADPARAITDSSCAACGALSAGTRCKGGRTQALP